MPTKKYYVVWVGTVPGVYTDWNECLAQIHSVKGAKYKAFDTQESAEKALQKGYKAYLKAASSNKTAKMLTSKELIQQPIANSLAVDAACSGNPGDMEYRGVSVADGREIFHVGPMKKGTNNIGEFLAIVHGLALLKQRDISMPIYSDSRNGIKWVKDKKCKTMLQRIPENEPIFDLIERAEKWLKNNVPTATVIKWNTEEWGEIPADFGRK